MENLNPVELLAFLGVLGIFVTKAVDAIRRQWPRFDGLGLTALAWVLGALVAAGLDIRATEAVLELLGGGAGRTPAAVVDWLITGAVIAAGAGVIHDAAKRPTLAPTVVVDSAQPAIDYGLDVSELPDAGDDLPADEERDPTV